MAKAAAPKLRSDSSTNISINGNATSVSRLVNTIWNSRREKYHEITRDKMSIIRKSLIEAFHTPRETHIAKTLRYVNGSLQSKYIYIFYKYNTESL